MSVTTPEWLSKHGGELRQATVPDTWLILLGGQPQYRLVPVPAAGKSSCQVTQTNNGRRLDGGASYASADEALQGGLEDLRKALGW